MAFIWITYLIGSIGVFILLLTSLGIGSHLKCKLQSKPVTKTVK